MRILVKSLSSTHSTTELVVSPGLRLLDFLQDAGIRVNAACGGKGTCTKCRIQTQEGFLPITPTDRRTFSEEELVHGWRLSCQSRPRANVTISVPLVENINSQARVISHDSLITSFPAGPTPQLVCDLGSTGVVVALCLNQKIMAESHILNRQIRFGADVMTRLQAAQEKGVSSLQTSLLETLEASLKGLADKNHLDFLKESTHSTPLYISGNSTMISLLLGWDITSLAVAPFQPQFLVSAPVAPKSLSVFKKEKFPHLEKVELRPLPLLGGFVGADTFAGLCMIDSLNDQYESWILVDIGTNTEIVLRDNKGQLWFGSAPAGPAFEGGNITHGMRAEPGAISEAILDQTAEDHRWTLKTISNDRAVGICGSGLIDVISEGVRSGLIHSDGYLPQGHLKITDTVGLFADDVREFQLAKSATRTACEILMAHAKARPHVIFLAGTFAQHLNLKSLERVGLLPTGIPVRQIGNASLLGTALFSGWTIEQQNSQIERVSKFKRQIELALQDDFQEIFVKNINFTSGEGV